MNVFHIVKIGIRHHPKVSINLLNREETDLDQEIVAWMLRMDSIMFPSKNKNCDSVPSEAESIHPNVRLWPIAVIQTTKIHAR